MGVDSLDVRVFWPSTHASIPSGWTRDTAFDARFLQGDDSGYASPSNSGGSHGHTANDHTHTGISHTHTFSALGIAPSSVTLRQHDRGFFLVPDASPPTGAHTHVSETSLAATITYQNASVTINTTDAQPPYMKLIVIKPDLATSDVPDDAVCFTDETSLPMGFAKYASLDDRFVLGADTGSGDGGGTGGTATHTHTSPGTHNHQDDSHGHAQAICGIATPSFRSENAPPTDRTLPLAHHRVSLDGKTLSDVTQTAVTFDAASSEPAHIKLLGIQNTSGAAATPVGIIVAFVGDADDIASNWQLCDGTGDTINCTNRQIKSTAVDGDIGDTAGANTHNHPGVSHGHSHTATHNHTESQAMYQFLDRKYATPLRNAPDTGTHVHSWIIGSTGAGMQSVAVPASTDDGRSAYRMVVWIKKLIERPGPKGLLASTF